MSTSTWNPERRFPWLGDTVPCPSPAELADLAAEDREAEVVLRGEEHVARLEAEANLVHPVYGSCGCGAAMDEHGCPHGH